MTLDTLTTFFGWMALLNIVFLGLAALLLLTFKNRFAPMHAAMFDLDETEVKRAYFRWLAYYKIAALIFSIIPYIALRLM